MRRIRSSFRAIPCAPTGKTRSIRRIRSTRSRCTGDTSGSSRTRELKWPLKYFKHVITPLPFAEAERRGDRKVLSLIRESLAHLEINGPNTIIAVLPDGSMMTCCDSKKLRPVVVGGDGTTMAISSEVCGLNAVLPDRDASRDIYPNEREVVLINNDLAVQRWNQ